MIKKITAHLLCFALFSSPLHAVTHWTDIFSSTLSTSYSFYDQDSEFEAAQHFFSAELLLDGNIAFGDLYQLQLKPRLRFDNQQRVNGQLQLQEHDVARPAATFEELHLTRYGEQFEFSIGKQVFSWGMGDLLNPTDDINPIDILDPLNSEKLGQLALSLRYLGNTVNLHAVVVVDPDASRIPEINNRWFRSTTPIQTAAASILGFVPDVVFTPAVLETRPRFGLQLSSSSLLAGWDMELTYFYGHDPIGVYASELTSSQVNLSRVFPEFDEVGAGFFYHFWRI